jgi:3-phenylpropionate/cinnamic acid dioxygenase small subunit
MTGATHFDRAEATEAIRRIVLSYPEASDTGDLPGVGRFMDGVRLGHFGLADEEMAIGSADAAAEMYARSVVFYPDGLSHAKHLITNVDIGFSDGGQSARAHSTYVVLQARPELPLQPICTGRYDDTLSRTDGSWRLVTRRECMDLKGELGFHVSEPSHLLVTPDAPFAPVDRDAGPEDAEPGRSFDRALATEQIRRIVLTYPERVDRGDFAAVGAFLDGVAFGGAVGRNAERVPDHQMRSMTAAEIESLYRAAVLTHDDGLPHTKHLITNIDVRFSDDGRSATTRSYYTVLQGWSDFPLQIIISGRYDDEFEAADGGWRLVSRREYTDLVGDLSKHVSADTLGELSADHPA